MGTWFRSFVTALGLLVCILIATIAFVAPNLDRRVAASPAVEAERLIVESAPSLLVLRNLDGSVRIDSYDGEKVRASVAIRIYTRERGLDALAAEYAASLVSVSHDEQRLEIVTEPKERPDTLEVFADYAIQVPHGMSVDLVSENGNVRIGDDCGSVEIEGRNADIAVLSPRGQVTIRTTNGRISVLNAQEETHLETINGNIYAYMKGGSLRAGTTNGALVAHLQDPQVTDCDLTTRNGGITVVLAKSCSAQLEARTARGTVKSDYFVNTAQGIERRRHLRGSIGQGGTQLTMDTLNGNIWIKE